jgi:hypothetical protein
MLWCFQVCDAPTQQIILELCIPEKELAKTPSQISFIYFQSHLWYSVRNYKIPKGIMKTRFETRLPRMSLWKKLHNLDLNSGPLHKQQVFCHWTIKARCQKFSQINISSIQNYQGLSFLPVTYWFGRFVPSTGILKVPKCEILISWILMIFLSWSLYR